MPFRSRNFLDSVPQRRKERKKRLTVRISAAAVESSTNDTVIRRSLTSIGGKERSALSLGKSSAAMERLDFERGVCVPFRKYTPETVRTFIFIFFTVL